MLLWVPASSVNHLLLIHWHWALQKGQQNMVPWFSMPGAFQLHEGKQRPSQHQPPGREYQTLLPTASGSSHQGKHKTVQLWVTQHFHSERKRTGSKIHSSGLDGSLRLPRPAGALAAMQGNWPTLTQHSKDSDPIPVESEILRLKASCTGLNWTKKHLLSLKQETRWQVQRKLCGFLSVRWCPGPEASSHVRSRGGRLWTQDWFSPQNDVRLLLP